MKYFDIGKGLIDGSISIDFMGHQISGFSYGHHTLIDNYNWDIEGMNGAHDGKWTYDDGKDHATKDASMREAYRRKLEVDYNIGEDLWFVNLSYCQCCGMPVTPTFEGDKLVYRRQIIERKIVVLPMEEARCKFEHPEPIVGKIKVNSKLIFANYFQHIPNTPEGKKHDTQYSLNFTSGQVNITKYKSEVENVAFGQMGNMSVGIYTSKKDKNKIIIASPWYEEKDHYEEDDKEYKNPTYKKFPHKGFKLVGQISLCVWRWEATDLNTLTEEKLQEMKDEEYPQDIVELDVPHGEWEFTHWYETNTHPDRDEHIYSEFNLIKP